MNLVLIISKYRVLALAAPLAAGLLSARPAAAATVISDFSTTYTEGAEGSGNLGPGYTPFFFDITFDNTTSDTYMVSSATFNGDDLTTVSYIDNFDVSGLYNGSLPFDLKTGQTTQPQMFELDVDGNVPAGTTLTGHLDFEGSDDQSGQQLTVADPVLSFTVPASASSAPEPSEVGMLALVGIGLGGLMLRARRRAS